MRSDDAAVDCALDSHGDRAAIARIVHRRISESAGFLFLGDGLEEFLSVMAEYPAAAHLEVPGNNDDPFRFPDVPRERIAVLCGRRLLLVHGHRHGVKADGMRLFYSALEKNAEAALYGHTHAPVSETRGGLLFCNPGALRYPWNGRASYGILRLSPDKIEFSLSPAEE